MSIPYNFIEIPVKFKGKSNKIRDRSIKFKEIGTNLIDFITIEYELWQEFKDMRNRR